MAMLCSPAIVLSLHGCIASSYAAPPLSWNTTPASASGEIVASTIHFYRRGRLQPAPNCILLVVLIRYAAWSFIPLFFHHSRIETPFKVCQSFTVIGIWTASDSWDNTNFVLREGDSANITNDSCTRRDAGSFSSLARFTIFFHNSRS